MTKGKRESCLLSKGPERQAGSATEVNTKIQKGTRVSETQ